MPTASWLPCVNRNDPRSTEPQPLIQYDERRYKNRVRVGTIFCRLKDFCRIATRYDKRARKLLSDVSLAAAVAFCL